MYWSLRRRRRRRNYISFSFWTESWLFQSNSTSWSGFLPATVTELTIQPVAVRRQTLSSADLPLNFILKRWPLPLSARLPWLLLCQHTVLRESLSWPGPEVQLHRGDGIIKVHERVKCEWVSDSVLDSRVLYGGFWVDRDGSLNVFQVSRVLASQTVESSRATDNLTRLSLLYRFHVAEYSINCLTFIYTVSRPVTLAR